MPSRARDSAIQVNPKIRRALRQGQGVVALESAVITHGLPSPTNLTLAAEMESIITNRGALPATVGLLRGRPIVGLMSAETAALAASPTVRKVTVRDLPAATSAGLDGATTVASTLFLAHRAGVKVMCTGGIGGVHRGAARSMDISADLPALASTPMVVVCAGPKTLVDAALTMEWLETNGVPVVGFQTDTLPLFYVATSPLPVSHRADSIAEVAALARASWQLDLSAAILVVVPVPPDDALEPEELDRAIEEALRQAEAQGVGGPRLTPFVLSRLRDLTAGKTLQANLALLRNNAALAADIARALGGRF